VNRPIREEVDDLIVRTREAHEVLKDIRTATRELREVIDLANATQESLVSTLHEVVHEGIDTAIEVGLASYTVAIETAINDATDAVYKRFDSIAGIMLGDDEDDIGKFEKAARIVRKSVREPGELTAQEIWWMDQMQDTIKKRIGEV